MKSDQSGSVGQIGYESIDRESIERLFTLVSHYGWEHSISPHEKTKWYAEQAIVKES